MDAKSAVLDSDESENKETSHKTKGDAMAKMKLDGAEHEVDAGLASAIRSEFKAREDATKEVEAKLDQLKADSQKEKDALQAKVDALVEEKKALEEKKMDDKEIHRRVAARTALLETAKKALPEDTKFDEMTDLDIKKAVVEAKCTNLDEEKMKSEVYVEARFDHIAETITAEKADGNKKLKESLGKTADRTDVGDADSAKSREKSMKADSEAWTKPIGFSLKTA